MARCAEDLRISMEIITGIANPKLSDCDDDDDFHFPPPSLPRPNKHQLSSFRVALIRSLPICPTSMETRRAVECLGDKLRAAGAEVVYLDEEGGASLPFDPKEMMRVYLTLLNSTMSAVPATGVDMFSKTGDELRQMFLKNVARFSDGDDSLEAIAARAPFISYGEWKKADTRRHELRIVWRDFFTPVSSKKSVTSHAENGNHGSDRYDFLICPAFARCAFPHDHSGENFFPMTFAHRTLAVDGQPGPYERHLFWSGLTNTCFLPSTVFPSGLGKDSGMPIGLQVVGPERSDFKTIDFVRMLEVDLGYTFQKPPNEFGED